MATTKMVVPISEYPQNKEWKFKTFAMPKLPTGDNGETEIIYKILKTVQDGKTSNDFIKFEGNDKSFKLERMYEGLRPLGLLKKENSVWKLTDLSEKYLETHDNLYLTAIFCSSLVFMGEILYLLKSPQKINYLLEIAVEKYKINWKTPSEIRNRIKWFRDIGFINYEDFKLEYSLTNLGEEFLNKIKIVMPSDIEEVVDSTELENKIPLSDWSLNLYNNGENYEKKMTIGYIPGKTIDAINIISEYLHLLMNETFVDDIREYSTTNYQIAPSSSNAFLTFLNNIGFVNRLTKLSYKISEYGIEWLDNESSLNFVICLEKRFLFIFDILAELSVESRTTKELTAIAKSSYGFDRENIDEIRKRIIFLKAANLIIEDGLEKYKLTSRGKKILSLLNIKCKKISNNKSEKKDSNVIVNNLFVEELVKELRLSSKDSSNPSRFEKSIRDVFEYLGFKTNLFGGSGKTDVLIQSQTSERFSYKVAIDAKSTASGTVGEGLINFNSIEEHRELHKADYSLIIGCSFQGEKIYDRAQKSKVGLLDVDSLESLIREHSIIPLTSSDYKKIFQQNGLISIDVVEDARNIIKRHGLLVSAIMKCLTNESMDEVTQGVLSSKEIYRSVRDDSEYNIEPTLADIEDIINILSSPLINCIGITKDGYYATGSLIEAGNKFEFYARACLSKEKKYN